MEHKEIISYHFETIDLTKYCRNYLIEHNYFQNDQLTNINLVERSLINYSIIKLTADWNFTSDDIKENTDNLLAINRIIDNTIPSNEEKKYYFSAYIYCILYLFSAINMQSPIKWSTNQDCPENEIICNYDGDIIIEIVTNPNANFYELPNKLLDIFKDFYKKKEDPKVSK